MLPVSKSYQQLVQNVDHSAYDRFHSLESVNNKSLGLLSQIEITTREEAQSQTQSNYCEEAFKPKIAPLKTKLNHRLKNYQGVQISRKILAL